MRDLVDLARRFGRQLDPPRTVDLPAPRLGETQRFDLLTLSSPPGRRTVTAALRAVSEHAYFFVQRGADVGEGEVDAAVRTFEEEVWPAVTNAFGLPPIPGVDGDPRIVLLHADLGSGLGGYVWSEDAYPRSVVPHSNQREIVYLNLTLRPLGSAFYGRTLAHELQHLIHRQADFGEDSWVNEGLSEAAAALIGGPGSYDAFLRRPDLQLNDWAEGLERGAHYDASGLFFTYLLEQSEGDLRELTSASGDGVAGVRAYLSASGEQRTFADVVADWAVANLLDQSQGPYGYRTLDPPAAATQRINGPGAREGTLDQFAADYLELHADDFAGEPTFAFEGDRDVPIVAIPESDGAFWWSNRGDSIDATLTRELDLTNVSQATLTFRTWYDIERWFDYGYVAVSNDGGDTWSALAGERTTADDPLAVAYGPGYTGVSGGGSSPRWVEERIDLSSYAGTRILLRFEYVTDDGLHGRGWLIDDVAVPEIGFFDDAESNGESWQRAGFLRVVEPLPQRFELRLVTLRPTQRVEEIALDGENRAQIRLTGLGTEYDRAVIVIIAVTEGTTEPAGYRYDLGDQSDG